MIIIDEYSSIVFSKRNICDIIYERTRQLLKPEVINELEAVKSDIEKHSSSDQQG